MESSSISSGSDRERAICLISGDGVGREVIPAARRVLEAVLAGVSFVEADAGWDCFVRTGSALPDDTVSAVASAAATLFGATQSPSGGAPGYASPILSLRKRFELFANVRPTRALLPGGPAIDLCIVRENTEGLYSGRERLEGDTAIAERVITRMASTRIARRAFAEARRRAFASERKPKVTIVHKANVLKLSDGLFRESCLAVSADYPDVIVEEMLVDAAAMWLARDSARFDVIVTTNLFGDILSDLAAGLAGGLGIAPSANTGAGTIAVFEPVHGSAPDIAGRGIANPLGAILSAAMLLEHIGCPNEAECVRSAVLATLNAGIMTTDLGGEAGTFQVADAVCERLGVRV